MAKGATKDSLPEDSTRVAASAQPAKGRAPGARKLNAGRIAEARRNAEAAALVADPVRAPADAMAAAPTLDETDSEGRAMVAALMDRMIDEHIAKWAEARTRTRAILAQISR